MSLEQHTEGGISRRHFLKGTSAAAGAVALEALGGCATFQTDPRRLPVKARVDFDQHNDPPRGIDFQFDGSIGPYVTAPTLAYVISNFGNPREGFNSIWMETPLGRIIHMSGFEEVFAQPNDIVTPRTIIGTEGKRAPKGPSVLGPVDVHTHFDLRGHSFFPDSKYGEHFEQRTGNRYQIYNPHENSANGNMFSSLYDGRILTLEDVIKEAEGRFNLIGEKYQREHVGELINESRKMRMRFSPRVMMAWKAMQHGLVENERMKEELLRYFAWHASLKEDLFLIYRNPDLMQSYAKPDGDTNRREKARDFGAFAYSKWGDWDKTIEAYSELGRISPIWHEILGSWALGIAYNRITEHKRAIIHLLVAEGLADYKWAKDTSERKRFNMEIYRNLADSHVKRGLFPEGNTFRTLYQKAQS